MLLTKGHRIIMTEDSNLKDIRNDIKYQTQSVRQIYEWK